MQDIILNITHLEAPKAEPDNQIMDVDAAASDLAERPQDMAVDVVEGDDDIKQPTTPQPPLPAQANQTPVYPGGFAIDVAFEASKLPLDVAIFNSARAAGGDDKIRKYLQAVLIIGGSALIPGMGHALESRSGFSFFVTSSS